MTLLRCRCRFWVFLKLVLLWALSIFATSVVLLYTRPPQIIVTYSDLTDNEVRFENKIPDGQPNNITEDNDMLQKAEKVVGVGQGQIFNLNHLFKKSNKSSDQLEMLPKLQKIKTLDVEYRNRPELKNFLRTKLNLTELNNLGPETPQNSLKNKLNLAANLNSEYRNRPELKKFLNAKLNLSELNNVGPELPQKEQRRKLNIAESLVTEYKFVMNVHDRCTTETPFIVLFIHSAIDRKDQRELIRQSWAKVASYKGYTLRTVFILAQPDPRIYDAQTQKRLSDNLYMENQLYDDIVQGDFIDNYRNLTSKHLLAYNWIQTYCQNAKYVIKIDDDTLVNIFRVVDFLSGMNPLTDTDDLFYCGAFINYHPQRNPKDKWYVDTKEYPKDRYPTYCEGFAYITTPGVVTKLYSESSSVPPFWIDDVYVTGMLAEVAGVGHKQFRDPNGYNIMHQASMESYNEVAEHALFILAKYRINEHVWNNLWSVISQGYKSKEYVMNSRYKNPKYHLPHHTL